MLRSFFDSPNHLNSRPTDTPISHISKTGENTLTLSTAKPSEITREKFVKINEPIVFIADDIDTDDWQTLFNLHGSTYPNQIELLKELKEYLNQKEITWSIGNNHVGVLCEYQTHNYVVLLGIQLLCSDSPAEH
jgi:hypothetical protein